MRQQNIFFAFGLLFSTFAHSATIVDIGIIHQQLIVIHFDDGYVEHHKIGEPRTNETAIVAPLDLEAALQLSAYQLTSTNDPNYTNPMSPVDIGRKSKATDFAWLCETFDNGCINTSPDHAKEHWIYLYLPQPLSPLKTYTLTFDSLATNQSSWTFLFSDKQLISDAIHINREGYQPNAGEKFAYLYHWAGDKGGLDFSAWEDKYFYLLRNGFSVFTGLVKFRAEATQAETGQIQDTPNGNFLGADVWECDFSGFGLVGEFQIHIPGLGTSPVFSIRNGVYQDAFIKSIRGLYHNRSGIPLEAPYTSFTRPAPHSPTLTPGFENRLKYSSFRAFDLADFNGNAAEKPLIEAAEKGNLTETWGWYQDAGDWDGYYQHSHIPAWLFLLNENYLDLQGDGRLNIPESGNSISDIFDEAMWFPQFLHRARQEITNKGWGTGGVPGSRIFGDLWGDDAPNGIGQGSWQDTNRDWYLLGEDPWMTYKYAGMAANIAYLIQANGWDPTVDWEQEAISAWNWAQNNTLPGDENEQHGIRLAHVRMYAAVQLLRLTGAAAYNSAYLLDAATEWPATGILPGTEDLLLATYFYAILPNNLGDPTQKNKARELITAAANEELITTANQRACRWGGNFYFPMLVGQGTTPMIQAGVLGYLMQKDNNQDQANTWLNRIRTTADYFLGNNPLHMSWVTGVNNHSPREIFHLDWWYGGKTAVLPGVIPYGPWRSGDYGPLGPWNHMWAAQYVHPPLDEWPGHERWFAQRSAPLTSEFTVHQNTRQAAVVYGILANALIPVSVETPPTSPQPVLITGWFDATARQVHLHNRHHLSIQHMALWDENGRIIQTHIAGDKTAEYIHFPVTIPLTPGIYLVNTTLSDKRSATLKIWMR